MQRPVCAVAKLNEDFALDGFATVNQDRRAFLTALRRQVGRHHARYRQQD
jgi:hypothetical protein